MALLKDLVDDQGMRLDLMGDRLYCHNRTVYAMRAPEKPGNIISYLTRFTHWIGRRSSLI